MSLSPTPSSETRVFAAPMPERLSGVREGLGFPDALRRLIENSDSLVERFELPDERSAELKNSIKRCTLGRDGANLAEAGLFAAVLRSSPEAARFLDWLSSAAIPGVPVPLHPAAFSLIGTLYFFARLVTKDPAVCTRAIEAYSVEGKGGGTQAQSIADELEARFREVLGAMIKDDTSCFGRLLSGEVADTNSLTQTQLLAGILAPVLTQMTHSSRGAKPTLGDRIQRLNEVGVPKHLSDLGLLGDMQFRHALLVLELAESYESLAKKSEECRKKRDAETNAQAERDKQQRLRDEAKSTRIKANEAAIERLLGVAEEGEAGQLEVSNPHCDAVLRTVYETIARCDGISDEGFYLLIEKLPRTSCVKQAGILDDLIKDVNRVKKEREGSESQGWSTGTQESVVYAILWRALSKIMVVVDRDRFARSQHQLLRFISDAKITDEQRAYNPEFLADVSRVFLSYHERRCQELLGAKK